MHGIGHRGARAPLVFRRSFPIPAIVIKLLPGRLDGNHACDGGGVRKVVFNVVVVVKVVVCTCPRQSGNARQEEIVYGLSRSPWAPVCRIVYEETAEHFLLLYCRISDKERSSD